MSEELVAPASYAQERIWLDCQLEPELPIYNLVTTVSLPVELDLAELTGMLAAIVDRHETLRTSLELRDGELVQVVAARLPVAPPPVTDLSGEAPAEQRRRLDEIRRSEVSQPFTLDRPPLWRVRLVRLTADWQLLFSVHHTIYDAGSATVLEEELFARAAALRERRAPRLPELEIQYADFAVWQRQLVEVEAGKEQLAYWLDQLAGLPAVHAVPMDRPRPQQLAHPGDDVFFDLPAGTGAAAEALARRFGATELMVMFAGYVALLAGVSGKSDVVVGVPAMGRDQAELRPLIGMFVNTLVIRVDASGDPTFGDLLCQVRDRLFEAWDRQDVPFQLLVQQLVGRRPASHRPLFQLAFNHLKGFDRGRSHGVARDELQLMVTGEQGRLEYRTDLFDRATAENLVETYVRVLTRAIADPQLRVAELVGADQPAAVAPQPVATVPVGRARYPLSFSQERMWVLDRLAPGDPVYNMPMAMRLRGPLRVDALQSALDTLVERHSVLRTVFGELDGEPFQVVEPAAAVSMPVEDLSAVAEPARLAMAREVTGAEARAPFDLSTGPLLRAKLLRLADDDHFLLLTLHHIVADGWSLSVFATELSELYRAGVVGAAPQLPQLPLGYGEYASWQRQQLAGAELDRQLTYWSTHLAGAPALLELPTEQPRPAEETFAGNRFYFRFAPSLADGLTRLASQTDATVFMVLLAALQVTLARYSGQSDVVIGTPVAGRTYSEFDSLIGLFVNTLALRGRLTGNPRFRELVAQARETTLAGLSNQDLPFEKLVEILQPERSLSHSPIVQVQLLVQNAPSTALRLTGLTVESESRHTRTAKFDLTVEVTTPRGEPPLVALEYKTDLFSQSWVERFAACFTAVLSAAVTDADVPVFDIDLLPAGQRAEVLTAPNRGLAPLPSDCVVPELLAALTADGAPVLAGSRVTGLPELAEWSARLATVLAGHGVGPDVPVGLCLDRSGAMLAGMLGVWRAGGAYVPLDPAFPPDRLRMMVDDSGLRVIVTHTGQRQLAEQLAGERTVVVCLDSPAVAAAAPLPQPVPLHGDNLAYVIYTSGSTGRPKGVQVPHRPLANLLYWFRDTLRPATDDTLVAVTTLSFDIAVLELLLPLLAGCRLVIAEQEQSSDPRLLRRLVEETQATIMQATPATWRMLVSSGGVPAGLRTRLCGGEALPRDLADELVGADVMVWNVYGPTETTVWSAAGVVPGAPAPIEVGPPIGNTQLYVLDQRLLLVPLGVAGEVYIGGTGVTRGYHGRAGLTAERFLPDPFSTEPGARMYRTGDLARRVPGGQLEFLGRADNQVKVRGFRIEIGEIESVLAEHPAVRQGVVTADTSAGETRLVGYVVPTTADASPAELWPQLRPHLRSHLPEYMLPATLVVLPELPLTPNGKLDRRALPAPTWGAVSDTAHVAPRTEVEQQLAEAWAELLAAAAPIGVHDDFFTLGGHSLTATRLVARIRSLFGPQLSLRDVFAGPTIAELATAIVAHPDYGRQQRSPSTTFATPAPATTVATAGDLQGMSDEDIERLLQAAMRERQARQAPAEPERYPLSPFQRRLWFLHQLTPDEPTYTLHDVWPMPGEVDPTVVRRAFDALIARHPALRTTFKLVEEEPVQVVAPTGAVDLTFLDVADKPEPQRLPAARQSLAEELRRPFDLTRGPLLRVRLVRLRDDQHVLLMNLHHLIVDAWSVRILRNEFARLFREYTTGVAADLLPLTADYGRYAAEQAATAGQQRLREQRDYWTDRLAGAPALLELPTDRPRPPVQTFRPGMYRQPLSPEATTAVLAMARRVGAPPYPLLLAAFQLLLARYSGQPEVVVGTPVSRRSTEDLDPVVGLFVNTVVARADLRGNPTVRELLAAARSDTVAALSHADVPFDEVIEALRPDRSAAYQPVFQVMFVFDDAPDPLNPGAAVPAEGLAEELVVPLPAARFDLTLSVRQLRGRFVATFDYNADLFDEGTIAQFAHHFTAVVEAITADPDQRVWDVALMSEREQEDLVAGRQPVRGYPQRFVHDLVVAAAATAPSAPALLADGVRLSYGELVRWADSLARLLQEFGVGPDQRVGVALPAGPDALVAVLGILRAGGAYLPVDPSHPAERLAWILADAGAEVLVTTGRYADRFAGYDGRLVLLEQLPEPASEGGSGSPTVPVHPLNAAYVIYTSGSTGTPKGVVVSHAALSNLTQSFVEIHGFTAADRLLMIPPLSFDASVGDIFPALVTGAALVLHPQPAGLSGKDLLRWCAEQRVTVVDAPSALWQQWAEDLATAGAATLPGPAGSALTQLMIGGESVPTDKLRSWTEATGGKVRVVNHYGPTEATVCATTYTTVDGSELGATAYLPAGEPVWNTRCYVLDRSGRPVPDGVPGELCIGGAGVARGYLGQPGLTAERFAPDPYADEPGARLYRTGDRARWNADGQLEFLGRTDAQVKIRGHRVELREVEAAIAGHPEVREAVVVAHTDPAGWHRLVGYAVPQPTAELTLDQLRGFLRDRLPEYLLPTQLMLLDALPLTSHGKVDRKALPEPPAGGDRPTYQPPATETEVALAEIWAAVLSLTEPVGRDDDFFALGGHSLLAVSLMSRIRSAIDYQPPVQLLFQARSLAELAASIDAARGIESGSAIEVPAIDAPVTGVPSTTGPTARTTSAALVAAAGSTEPDLRVEAVLPDDVCADLATYQPRELATVLLTGATGFLGAFLLEDLLRHTQAQICCLVRAGSVAAGAERIERNLRHYQLWQPEYAARIVPVPGDLATPRLGLSDGQFQSLADELDAIYHNGGLVNFLRPYEWLKPANVTGTLEVLRMASAQRPTPVHFVSTLGVFLGESYRCGQVSESDQPADPDGLRSAYNQSKWVADALVRAAAERGLPVTIHRPARVSGDSRTGVSNPDDYFSRMLKTFVELGSVPLWESETDLYPVDVVSATIGHVSRRAELLGQGFHYFNNALISYDEVAVTLRRAGFRVRRSDYPQWRSELLARLERGEESALAAFAPALPETEPDSILPVFDCRQAERYAAEAGVPCPPADGALLRKYLDYFISSGYLAPTAVTPTRPVGG